MKITATRHGSESSYNVRIWEKNGKRIAYISSDKRGYLEYDLVKQAYRSCKSEINDTVIREQIEAQVKGL